MDQEIFIEKIQFFHLFFKGIYTLNHILISSDNFSLYDLLNLYYLQAKDMIENVPGIGRYSAGAISSIAYNQCEPVVGASTRSY